MLQFFEALIQFDYTTRAQSVIYFWSAVASLFPFGRAGARMFDLIEKI